MGAHILRAVTHLDIDEPDVLKAADLLGGIIGG